MVRTPSVAAAAQISFAANLRIARLPVELSVGSSTGNLASGAGTQHDAFMSALRTWRLSRYLVAGAGVGCHRLQTTLNDRNGGGVAPDYDASGFRPALEGTFGLNLPLAPADGAAIRLTGRVAAMHGVTQLGVGFSVLLAPARGRLMLGEAAPAPVSTAALTRSWDAIVAEIMLLENRLPPLQEVRATGNTLMMKLYDPGMEAMRDAVSRIARVLNGSAENIGLVIRSPDPAILAAAATSAGFPAERIVLEVTPSGATLQATRPRPAAASRTAR